MNLVHSNNLGLIDARDEINVSFGFGFGFLLYDDDDDDDDVFS